MMCNNAVRGAGGAEPPPLRSVMLMYYVRRGGALLRPVVAHHFTLNLKKIVRLLIAVSLNLPAIILIKAGEIYEV